MRGDILLVADGSKMGKLSKRKYSRCKGITVLYMPKNKSISKEQGIKMKNWSKLKMGKKRRKKSKFLTFNFLNVEKTETGMN